MGLYLSKKMVKHYYLPNKKAVLKKLVLEAI